MPASILKSQPDIQRTVRSGSVRAFAGAPISVDIDSRSFDITITTETPVTRYIPDPRIVDPENEDCSYITVGEVLLASGCDMSRTPRMPFVDCHDTYTSIDKVLGKVDDVRVEGQSIVGRVTLTRKRADLLQDIADGFYGQISAGYDYDMADTELVANEDGSLTLLVKRWVLTEASAVPVGADPNSFIRSAHAAAIPTPPKTAISKARVKQEKTMSTKRSRSKRNEEVQVEELEAVIETAEEAVAAVEEVIEQLADADVPEELVERARKLRGKREEIDEDKLEEERKRSDEDEEELTKEEEKEAEEVRSIARSYGMTKLVSDLRKLGAKPVEMKRALRKAIAERGAVYGSASDVTVASAKRSAAPMSDFQRARSAYDKLNGRK
jgi:hypothetical protein